MATTANIPVLLRHFAQKQGSDLVVFTEFCEYIKRYAEHHINEQPELIIYIGGAAETVRQELDTLARAGRILLLEPGSYGRFIAIEATAEKIAARYLRIIENPQLNFPEVTELPKYFASVAFSQQIAPGFFFDLLDQKKFGGQSLFAVLWPKNIPALLYPASLPVEKLLEAAVMKLRFLMEKETVRDYYLKKLILANAGHEIIARNFFVAFFQHPREALRQLEESGEAYYLWNQLCFYAKQDLETSNDLTADDNSKLQAIYIIEYVSTYYKNKAQETALRANALRMLETALEKPPYYYSYMAITKFADPKGTLLLGQYTEDELAAFLHERTTIADADSLPKLLTFKLESGQRYYIAKSNVLLLVARLLGNARDTVHDEIIAAWTAAFMTFNTFPEMRDSAEFEKTLVKSLRATSPVLFSLLNAPFLLSVTYEEQATGASSVTLFKNNTLLTYAEILLLSRAEMLGKAKSKVPFWYITPPFSLILKFLLGPKKKKSPARNSGQKPRAEVRNDAAAVPETQNPESANDPSARRKSEIQMAAKKLENRFVPEDTTIDCELASYERQWNILLDKEARQNLREDVNSLIRDYVRKIVKTLRGSTLDEERIHSLATTLTNFDSFRNVADRAALFMYTKLYIIRLLANMK
jgi:hypothetical protein